MRGGGVVLRMKTGVLARHIPGLIHNANIFLYQLSCRRFVSVFLLCALLSPEVGVAPGQAGLLRCAAARFSLAGLQRSLVVL